MGLSNRSMGFNIMGSDQSVSNGWGDKFIVTLAGNPNVGKSTVFNALTGLKQHTGNWPGKTVANAKGQYSYKGNTFVLVDVPGTYSMMSNSKEEQIARNFICFGNPDVTVVVADATCLERNLNLILQVLELTPNVVVCVNLLDEAKRKKIHINFKELTNSLGVPVVGTNARSGQGLDMLMDAVYKIINTSEQPNPVKMVYPKLIEKAVEKLEPFISHKLGSNVDSRWIGLKLLEGDESIIEDLNEFLGIDLNKNIQIKQALEQQKAVLQKQGVDTDTFRDIIVSSLVAKAEEIAQKSVIYENKKYNKIDRRIDKIVTSKIFGIPIMISLLAAVFWLTVSGANYPSELIASGLAWVEAMLSDLFIQLHAPAWLHDMVVQGVFRTLAWIVSVMLPPMAIFFPLFTLLEDLGYLPRIAFNLDNFFKKACAHGKQALTMCMGFGCNAAGVIGCRIIDSPRERIIAMITNNFVPCNGRFPTLIALSMIFFGSAAGAFSKTVLPTVAVTAMIVLGIIITLLISRLLSKTILGGVPSRFALELPPYRKPQVGKILIRSIFDRTLFVLFRAVVVAIPAGFIIWLMANIQIDGINILTHCAAFLDPFARLFGMDGYILMAFILGLPANEIVLPILLMCYLSTGSMLEYKSLEQLGLILTANGWTVFTALSVMLFSLMHFPCGTTLLTIRKESQSMKWTILSFVIPTVTGLVICFALTQTVRLLGWGFT